MTLSALWRTHDRHRGVRAWLQAKLAAIAGTSTDQDLHVMSEGRLPLHAAGLAGWSLTGIDGAASASDVHAEANLKRMWPALATMVDESFGHRPGEKAGACRTFRVALQTISVGSSALMELHVSFESEAPDSRSEVIYGQR